MGQPAAPARRELASAIRLVSAPRKFKRIQRIAYGVGNKEMLFHTR